MSGKLTITIETSNAAFDNREGYECARILRHFVAGLDNADYLVSSLDKHILRDVNGNRVGSATYRPHKRKRGAPC